MLKNLLRPKWQHPDPEIRAKALARGSVEVGTAVDLAVNDPDLRVRRCAVAALNDIAALVGLAGRCPELRTDIADSLEPLLLPRDAGAELRERDLAGAVELLTEQQRITLLRRAGSVRLRVLAVDLVRDPAALQERVHEDPDIQVRESAIARIDCVDTLLRIAELNRSTNLALAEMAEKRAETVRSRQVRAERRREVLDALRAMLDGSKPITEPAWEKHLGAWNQLAEDADDDARAAFEQAAAAIAPLLEEQRRRRAADQERREQREQILEQLAQLGRQAAEHELEQAEIAIDMLRRSWSDLEPMHDHWTERRLQQQFTEAFEQARRDIDHNRRERAQDQIVRPAIEQLEQTLARARLRDQDVTEARARVDAVNVRFKDKSVLAEARQQLRVLADRIAQRLRDQQADDQTRRQELKQRIEAYESALQAQELRPALDAHQGALAILQACGTPLPPAVRELDKRLRRNEPQLRQLKSWANWGNDHARQELIEEAIALQSAELQPDRLGKQVRALRERWKSLGKLGPGGKAQWEQFDAACTQAYEPVKAQREHEQQERKQHLRERETLCAEIEALTASTDWAQPDWRAADKALQQFRKRWREAGPVPHKSWKKILGRFEQAIDAFDARLEKERRHNFLQRQALVREAEQLAEQQDPRAAVQAAKELRGRWQLSVRSHPRQERELWDRFTRAMDAVFGREREERDQFRADLNDHLQQGEALCAELEALAGLDGPLSGEQRHRVDSIETGFRALGEVPKQARRRLEQRFEQARNRLDAGQRRVEQARAQRLLRTLYERHRLCTRLEGLASTGSGDAAAIDPLQQEWSELGAPESGSATDEVLEARWERARAVALGEGGADQLGDLEANQSVRRRICLDLEILLGRESPAEARDQRMARQVEMLQEAMSGAGDDRAERLRRLKLEYLQTGAAVEDPELAARFDALFALEPSESGPES